MEHKKEKTRTKNDIIKLNIGGTKFTTTRTTLTKMGENFLSRLVEGNTPSYVDEEGYYFVDRNGQFFGPILDYLRTGLLTVPPHVSTRSVLLEADFFSIDLSHTLCGTYIYEASHPDDRRLLFIERHPKERWCFGVTGILKEHTGRTYKMTEFWNKKCYPKDGFIECDNFLIKPHKDDVVVQQKDYFHDKNLKLSLVSLKGSGQPQLISDTWWVGDYLLTNRQYVKICFVYLDTDADKKWVALIKSDGEEPIGPYDVTILSDQFVIVEGNTDRFWIFVKKNPGRLIAYSPFWKKNNDGTYLFKEQGWMRFFPSK